MSKSVLIRNLTDPEFEQLKANANSSNAKTLNGYLLDLLRKDLVRSNTPETTFVLEKGTKQILETHQLLLKKVTKLLDQRKELLSEIRKLQEQYSNFINEVGDINE